ncbi:13822_t:CDS:1, partial [Gigaspora rosea]
VITDYGLTNPYTVEDGVDQGKTISPILWVIYYDPLISRISTKYKGFIDTNRKLPPQKEIYTS